MLKGLTRLFAFNNRAATRAFTISSHLRRPIDMEKINTSERLAQLRGLMKDHKVDIYSMIRSND